MSSFSEDTLQTIMATQPDAIKKLMYRSWYRGNREMDNVLGNYALVHLPQMTEAERALYAEFMEENDVDMWQWLSEQEEPPEAYVSLVAAIKQFQLLRAAARA